MVYSKYVVVMVVVANAVALALAVAIEPQAPGAAYTALSLHAEHDKHGHGSYMWMFIFTKGFYYMADNWGMKFLDHSWIGDPGIPSLPSSLSRPGPRLAVSMIIYMAALQGVPADLIESAQLAGEANSRQCFQGDAASSSRL